MPDNHPIVVYDIPDAKEDTDLWRNGGFTALAQAIIASILGGTQNDGDIIEMPTKVKEES